MLVKTKIFISLLVLVSATVLVFSYAKSNEETKMIPQIEEKLQKLRNRKVEFEGFVNSARYDLYKEVVLYDFKINNEKIPFLLSSQMLLVPCFDIYQAQNNRGMEIILIEDELGLQKNYIAGKGILRHQKGEELVIDISRHYELSLV